MTNEEVDHFDIDGLKLRYMRSSMGSMDGSWIVFVLMIPNFIKEEYRTEVVVPVPDRNFMQLNIEITETVAIRNITFIVEEENILSKMKIVNSCISNLKR